MKAEKGDNSAVLSLNVQPGAGRNEITDATGEVIRVKVTAAPENGKANRAVTELLAERLDVPKSGVTVVRGHTTRRKMVVIEGLTEAEVRQRLKQGP